MFLRVFTAQLPYYIYHAISGRKGVFVSFKVFCKLAFWRNNLQDFKAYMFVYSRFHECILCYLHFTSKLVVIRSLLPLCVICSLKPCLDFVAFYLQQLQVNFINNGNPLWTGTSSSISPRSFDFEITRMISDQTALHSVQLPLFIPSLQLNHRPL